MTVKLLPVAALLLFASTASAQSLADVAKKAEDARDKAKTAPAKVYTNDTLKLDPRDAELEAAAAAAVPPATVAPTPAATTTVIINTAPAGVVKDEQYWKTRMRQLQAQLDGDQTFAAAAIAREQPLNVQVHRTSENADFIRDRLQRAELQRQWQDVVAEVSRLKAAIVNDQRAIVDLQQEARRLGIAPGWLVP
jgi:hypothetical protein